MKKFFTLLTLLSGVLVSGLTQAKDSVKRKVAATDFETLPSPNGAWMRCTDTDDYKKNLVSYKTVLNVKIEGNYESGTVETIESKHTGHGCLAENMQESNVNVQSYKRLPGWRTMEIVEKSKDPNAKFLGRIDLAKYETKYTVVFGKPSVDGRGGHAVLMAFKYGDKAKLIQLGVLLHQDNKNQQKWAGRDVISEQNDDYFTRVGLDKIYKTNR